MSNVSKEQILLHVQFEQNKEIEPGLLGLTDEEGFERAGRVVPGEARPIPVPHLEAVLLLTVVVLEVVWLARVPVGVPGIHL